MTKKQIDKEIKELKIKLIQTTGKLMDNTHLETTLFTNEGVIVNSHGVITGVQKVVYNKKDDTRKYLFEINKQEGKYRIIVEDHVRGLSTIYRVNSMVELDELMKDNNPFRDVMYTFIGDSFKN